MPRKDRFKVDHTRNWVLRRTKRISRTKKGHLIEMTFLFLLNILYPDILLFGIFRVAYNGNLSRNQRLKTVMNTIVADAICGLHESSAANDVSTFEIHCGIRLSTKTRDTGKIRTPVRLNTQSDGRTKGTG